MEKANANKAKAKRVYIPKKNGKMRPLGIPIIKDRIFQNIVKNALEPQWEARFEPSTYGFRPKRGTQDAKVNLFTKLHSRSTRKWIYKRYFKPDYTGVSKDKWILTDITEFHIPTGKVYLSPNAKLVNTNEDRWRDSTTGIHFWMTM